jgi:hypothetical protein
MPTPEQTGMVAGPQGSDMVLTMQHLAGAASPMQPLPRMLPLR